MKAYIKNLVNRLSQFSEKLDKETLFVEKKWVLIDDEDKQQTFIFERNGDLVMSLNGKVNMGKWKYYPAARSILIDRITDQILLNQAFFDEAVMILKYDGLPDKDLFTLADANVIPDLDVKKHLQSVINKKFNVITGFLENDSKIEVYSDNGMVRPMVGDHVTIDGIEPIDGKYLSKTSGWKYEIKKGKIFNIVYTKQYKCSNDTILKIEQKDMYSYAIGDSVYIDDNIAESGKYKLGFLNYVIISDGVIKKFTSF